jgi:hypothetical protein
MHRPEIGGADEREEPAVRPNNGRGGQGPVPPPRRSHTRARELGGSSQHRSVGRGGPVADALTEGTFESTPMSPPDTHSAPLRPGRVRTGVVSPALSLPRNTIAPGPLGPFDAMGPTFMSFGPACKTFPVHARSRSYHPSVSYHTLCAAGRHYLVVILAPHAPPHHLCVGFEESFPLVPLQAILASLPKSLLLH